MLLETRGLTKFFGRMAAVSRLDLIVHEGELKSIIGPNGAGKTTFFNLITRKLAASEGEILFQGEPITKLRPSDLPFRGLSRSFQIVNLFPNLTVYENLWSSVQAQDPQRSAYWRRAQSLRQVEGAVDKLLTKLHLEEQRNEIAKHLSYGDQRILEIGIALGSNPKLLLLDEPTSGMSPLEARMTMNLIKELAQEMSILLIEHNVELVMSVSDSIAVLHYGEKIAEGPPAEIAADPLVRQAYLGTAGTTEERRPDAGSA